MLRGLHLLTLAVHVMHPSSSATRLGGGGGAAAGAVKGEGKGKGKGSSLAGDGSDTSDVEAFCIAITEPIVRPPLPPTPAAGVPAGGARGDGNEDTVRGPKEKSLQSREPGSERPMTTISQDECVEDVVADIFRTGTVLQLS